MGLVFVGEKSGPLRRNNFTTPAWKPALAKVPGLPPGLHFHDGRGFSATIAARHGATTKELMRRLGQASPAMAMRYQRAEAERDAILAQAMSRSVEATKARARHDSPAEAPRTA
jgi:integrase